MGAELIGYILVGPADISNKREVAIAAVNKTNAALDKWAADPDSLSEEDHELLTFFYDSGQDDSDAEELKLDAEKFVDEFIEFWNSGSRDSNFRLNPKDVSQKIVFAGDATWGDTPQGYGYELIYTAETFNVLDAFEIE